MFQTNEAKKTMKEFHTGDCGGHHSWKVTTKHFLRDGFNWPSIFSNVYKETTTCHQCQIFDGKRKLVPLPLNQVSVEAPFQQWGLDFIGEINTNASRKNIWILRTTDYFMKWIEAIPTKRDTDAMIMGFLEENILARFGCPGRIMTDNAATLVEAPFQQWGLDFIG